MKATQVPFIGAQPSHLFQPGPFAIHWLMPDNSASAALELSPVPWSKAMQQTVGALLAI